MAARRKKSSKSSPKPDIRRSGPFVHPRALVEPGSRIGSGTRVWAFAHVMKGAVIGDDCNICGHSFVESGSAIGSRVTIKNGVSVWEKVVLEDDVFVGPNAVFTNDLLPVSRRRSTLLPTRVKRGACIGANATILCGIAVGRYAFIGAGAVVTKSVPDHALCYGNPARIRGYLCRCRRKLRFSSNAASCGCGARFRMAGDRCVPRP